MVEYTALKSSIRALTRELSNRSPGSNWSGVLHLLDVAELEEAMDVLVATLVQDNAPLTRDQLGTLRELVDEFELDRSGIETYRYLGDLEMLDRMTVVDETS